MTFATLGLRAELLRAVAEQGYSEPTPVQKRAIPAILERRDILAGAQTGTGKTAGFTLPILQLLGSEHEKKGWRPIRALILTPTRELAAQVKDSVATYGRHLPIRSAAIFGGVGFNGQVDRLEKGVDVLVATPGRLQDHIDQGTVELDRVGILVLDEADRMLDMGFLPAIRKILDALPKQRQNLMFSATYSKEIRKLAEGLLRNPETIQIERSSTPAEGVTHKVHPVDRERKRELLMHLIESGDWQQVLVFTGKKHSAERLAKQLDRAGIGATSIHGNKSQNQRTRALENFKSGRVRVLVGTDVASRGLDIEELPHVVNYDLPNEPEAYIHRIGRTGRAGMKGEAVSLVAPEEHGLLNQIEQLLGRKVERITIPGFEPDPNAPRREAPQQRQGRQPQNNGKRHGQARKNGNSQPHWHRHSDRRDGRSRRNRPSA
ncbi:MAG TPA: DEAD/DEAH box helicase [Gammaproteobacteria bacterium]